MLLGAGAKDERTGERSHEHEAGDEEEPGARRLEQGQHERRDRAADRHGRLADAQREAAFADREPAHDRSPAARLDAAARDPGEPEQDDEPAEARRERGGREEGCAQAQPGRQRPALAEAVDGEAPAAART